MMLDRARQGGVALAAGLVPGFAAAAPRRTGEDLVAGLAAVSATRAAAAAAEGDRISRTATGFADLAAERPRRR